ncbi:MAG: hypothetical protein L3K23_02160 [Thermoplasmata archaeon]|nr:hypothetical protein [Thermoplasmata archaeon]
MAYDRADGYVLLYGETPFCCGFPYATQTWVYNSGEWSRLNLTVAPGARSGASMAYDARDGYVVLFGGCDHTLSPCELNETWKFHAGGWTNITKAIAPLPRTWGSMTYDAKDDYVLLFGGSGPVGGTWAFRAGAWRELNTATTPSNRTGAAMSYDATDRYVLLFGGFPPGGSGLLNDTWKFAGGNWTNITSSPSPSARSYPAATFDPKLGCVVLFGGIIQPVSRYGTVNDTWTYCSGTWTNVTPVHSPPDNPYGNGPIVYDGANGYAIMVVPKLYHGLMTWKLT